MPKLKITVLKTSTEKQFIEEYGAEGCEEECPLFDEGDEFVVDPEKPFVPDGFCSYAWDSIMNLVTPLLLGGDFSIWDWTEDDKTAIACCNDGLRPVFFKLEALD